MNNLVKENPLKRILIQKTNELLRRMNERNPIRISNKEIAREWFDTKRLTRSQKQQVFRSISLNTVRNFPEIYVVFGVEEGDGSSDYVLEFRAKRVEMIR